MMRISFSKNKHSFIGRTDTADESERAQNLLLRQQDLNNLIVGRGQTLKTHRVNVKSDLK